MQPQLNTITFSEAELNEVDEIHRLTSKLLTTSVAHISVQYCITISPKLRWTNLFEQRVDTPEYYPTTHIVVVTICISTLAMPRKGADAEHFRQSCNV